MDEPMKDSGVAWIGEIPQGWKVHALSQLATKVNHKNFDLQEQNLLSLSYGKIKRKDIRNNERLLPASFDGYNIIESGDIVLRLTDLQNDHTSLRVGRATEKGIITSAYVTIRPYNPHLSEMLYYALHAYDIKKGFYGMGSGVRQGLNYDEVKTIKVAIPDKNTVPGIVSYLNAKCAEIDAIISESKASVEEYKRWKASVIYQAVTKGLDPDAPMKDSGIPWIGHTPFHWKRTKISRGFSSIGSGSTPVSSEPAYYDGEIPWLQSGDIGESEVFTTSKSLSHVALEDISALKVYKAPFIAIAMYGASIANTSVVCIDACTNQACCVLSQPKTDIYFKFAYYAVLASKEELLLSARGGTQPNISQDIIIAIQKKLANSR